MRSRNGFPIRIRITFKGVIWDRDFRDEAFARDEAVAHLGRAYQGTGKEVAEIKVAAPTTAMKDRILAGISAEVARMATGDFW